MPDNTLRSQARSSSKASLCAPPQRDVPRVATVDVVASSSAAEWATAVPQYLSMACRYNDSHDACTGVVRLGGPNGAVVACECLHCRHASGQVAGGINH